MGVVERHSLLESPEGIICWISRRKRTDCFYSLFAATKLLQQTLEEKWKRRGEQKDASVVPSSVAGVWIQYLHSGLQSFVTRVLGHPAPPSVLHRLKAHTWHVTFIQAKHPYTFLKNKKNVIFWKLWRVLSTPEGQSEWRRLCGLWLDCGSQRPVQTWSREGCWQLRKGEGNKH